MSFSPRPMIQTSPVTSTGAPAAAPASTTAATPAQVGTIMAVQSLMQSYIANEQAKTDNIYRDLAVELGTQAALDMMRSAGYQTTLANRQDEVAVRSAIAAEEREGIKSRGRALVSAAERGVAGQSVDVQLNTIEQRMAENQEILEQDLFARREQRAQNLSSIRQNALSRINQLRAMPRAQGVDPIAAVLGAGATGYSTAVSMQAMQRQSANQSVGVQ